MTPPPTSRRRLLHGAALLVLLAATLIAAPAALGGEDDFEFGRKLAEARYFDYARKVYDGILDDKNRTDEAKDEARYGLALLKKEEALAEAGNVEAKYEDIRKLFDEASTDIEAFVKKNPSNPKSGQARLDVGSIRLAFVQWARELLDDPDEMAKRNIDADRLSEDARTFVEKAIDYFDKLRPDEDERKPKDYQELAAYYFVISQYYSALVEAPCSPAQMSALEKAGNDIEEYIMYHDGELLAVYAQDIYGLVWWEMAKCETVPEKQLDYYNRAFEWFETCIYTDDLGPDHQRIILSGYYHLAQACQDAGDSEASRLPTSRDFIRAALDHLEAMLETHPTAWRTDNGLRAMIEWSKLECKRRNAAKAIEVAKEAGDRAKAAGKGYIERLSNRQLNHYVSGGCGGGVSGLVDPDVLRRVADDLMLAGKHAEAIRAFRAVIGSTSGTTQAFLEHRKHAWSRIAAAYRALGDPLGEALAYEPIHDAWMQGRIPYKEGDETDPAMVEAGFFRRSSENAMKSLADKTDSPVFHARAKQIRDTFISQYPDHPTNRIGEWKTAMERWKQADKLRKKNDPKWRKLFQESLERFTTVSEDPKAQTQDLAWVYRIRVPFELGKYADAVKQAKEAWAWWDSKEAKDLEEKFPTVRKRRTEAKAASMIWMARCLKELERHDEVVAALKDWHATYPSVTGHYPSMAYDYLIQAFIAKGEIAEADTYYRGLLRANPKYFNLARLTFLLAGHYNDQRGVIEGELREITKSLNALRKELREASRQTFRLGALLADLQNQRNKSQQAIDFDKEKRAGGEEGVPPGVLEEHRKKIVELDERIPKVAKSLDEWKPKRDAAQVQVDKLIERQTELRLQIYEPLVRAAGYYLEWDEALKRAEVRRTPDNVAAFAYMFYQAGRLRAEAATKAKEDGNSEEAARLREEAILNWEKSRALYEDFLAFAQIKAKPLTDAEKRSAIARLGDVLVRLAEIEEDEAKRMAFVKRAVDLLQNSIANRAEDNDLVVQMLADKLLVLTWRDSEGKRWRFAIPRPATVAQLRKAIKKLGEDPEYPLPAFDSDQDQKNYLRALKLFRRQLAKRDDRQLKGFVGGTKSTFDPFIYRDLANTQPEFRLALAWAYAQLGRQEDVPKAVNLALSLIAGPLAVEEDTEEWWLARRIQLDLYLATADHLLTEGTSVSDAAQWLERAGKIFTGIAANFPDLGETAVKGNRTIWLKILEKMNKLRGKAGLTSVDVNAADLVAPRAGSGAPPGGSSEEDGQDN